MSKLIMINLNFQVSKLRSRKLSYFDVEKSFLQLNKQKNLDPLPHGARVASGRPSDLNRTVHAAARVARSRGCSSYREH